MEIYFLPFHNGTCFLNMKANEVALDRQVLNFEGLLDQLALHLGIHQKIPSYPERLTAYDKALKVYDAANPNNMFHTSYAIDSMSVAKTLLQWRDSLVMGGWNSSTQVDNCSRLNTLAAIDSGYTDAGVHALYIKVCNSLESGRVIPAVISNLRVVIPCEKTLLPAYIQNLLSRLKVCGAEVVVDSQNAEPTEVEKIEFTQQWMAEAWLSQQNADSYDVWINSDGKRMDNWLHMSGKPVCGSEMNNSNPQITQLFLLAVQLFQRPLNVNILLQYLYLPECPLHKRLANGLAYNIVKQGGFGSEEVKKCIDDYIANELLKDASSARYTEEERLKNLRTFLPFDLCDAETSGLAKNETAVEIKPFTVFLKSLKDYASKRAAELDSVLPGDARVPQLRCVVDMIEALMGLLSGVTGKTVDFDRLLGWAQSFYQSSDFTVFVPQVGSQMVLGKPEGMVDVAEKTIWCDFYGDVAMPLTTDFLSNTEMNQLEEKGLLAWKPTLEKQYRNTMLARPLHKTSKKLTVVVCKQQGEAKLPMHPLALQLPVSVKTIDGDVEFSKLQTKNVTLVANHRPSDDIEVQFDPERNINWRKQESFSALEKLLQNPLDYFMEYILGFKDMTATEIKMSLTNGNVAHEVIEDLFAPGRDFNLDDYPRSFEAALLKRGALLLLPENHFDKERLYFQLRRCIEQLEELIRANNLTVKECERKETQDIGFADNVLIDGYIDMLLTDPDDKNVVIDLKWTSKKDKHETLLKKNRAAQLAIYKELLKKSDENKGDARTGFFVMPEGCLYSHDDFADVNYKKVANNRAANVVAELIKGYEVRRDEINSGKIETSYGMPVSGIHYHQQAGEFPLETVNKSGIGEIKVENKYSDYRWVL